MQKPCLVGHQVSAPEIPIAMVDKALILLMSLEILLIFSLLILWSSLSNILCTYNEPDRWSANQTID